MIPRPAPAPDDPLGPSDRALLAGCGLPAAWRGAARWTVLELDFDDGLGCLATLRAWRRDPGRPTRLHLAALLRSPVRRETLRARLAAAGAASAEGADTLLSAWPIATNGVHRLELVPGRVVLTLAIGPSAAMLPGLVQRADTLHLGGTDPGSFAPAVLRLACGLLVQGACAASTSASPRLARDLLEAGMDVRTVSHPGEPPTLQARRVRATRAVTDPSTPGSQRAAMVIGAGLAGSALAFALARRGWSVEHLTGDGPAGSSQPALAQHPSVTPDDAPLSRLTRAALLLARGPYAVGALRACGRLQTLDDGQARAAAAGLPAEWVEPVDASGASSLAGVALRSGGLWLPLAACSDPDALREGWRVAGIERHVGAQVERLERHAAGWRALGASGGVLAEAPVAVIATGASELPVMGPGIATTSPLHERFGPAALQRRVGRTTIAQAPRGAMPRSILGGADGHAVPIDAQRLLLGPTGGPDAPDTAWQRHAARLVSPPPQPPLQVGPVGTRLSTRDHLPLAGPVPDLVAIEAMREALTRDDRLALPSLPGLWTATAFGGRGLLWSVLAAELIAARLDGEPSPLERDLVRALDPGRFLRRALRRGVH